MSIGGFPSFVEDMKVNTSVILLRNSLFERETFRVSVL